MKINGWGNYPVIDSDVKYASDYSKIQEMIVQTNEILPTGLFRSYGDSALAQNTLSTINLNKFLNFDKINGILRTESGVSFEEINEVTIPQGWFLPVTPGTKFVTVGGAIASDVHGKNHHKSGTFGQFVRYFKLMTADGAIITCSPSENAELYFATIGGMGLTGIILEAEFSLQKIATSLISQKSIKVRNLDELLDLFMQYSGYSYSVSWLDTAAKGKNQGRALLYLGEHSENKNLELNYAHKIQKINLPFFLPNSLLNQTTLKTLSLAYYSKEFSREKNFNSGIDNFFYPLDAIKNWNKGYGKRGFSQYQFVIPFENASIILKKVLNTMADYNQTSFLNVLKVFGEGNNNYLSFPQKGYTLAMDFAICPKTLLMFDELDIIIEDAGGRLYLTKDARMSAEFFQASYPKLNKFREVKAKFDPNNKFQSLQSRRLGI
jgi:FAD/FMN-containing dehydrogenase